MAPPGPARGACTATSRAISTTAKAFATSSRSAWPTFFVAGQRVLDAFAGGGVYRAYYAAGGGHAVMNRLLSAERIG